MLVRRRRQSSRISLLMGVGEDSVMSTAMTVMMIIMAETLPRRPRAGTKLEERRRSGIPLAWLQGTGQAEGESETQTESKRES